MYGLINLSIKNLINSRFGEDKWREICVEAGLESDLFISNKTYEDAITYKLVGASAKVLGMPQESVLQEFGRYWVLEVAPKGYGELLAAGGDTFEDFMINLPNFHTRVMLIYPQVRPPEFKVDRVRKRCLKLSYASERPGLLPFVEGLLQGLASRFSVSIKVEYLGQKTDDGSREFLIEIN